MGSSPGGPAEPAAAASGRKEAIEELVNGVRGVAGSRAVLDAAGELVELHVVSTGERPPKLIVRDIQSLLLVRLNLTVPHRRISVAVLGEPGRAGGRRMQQRLGLQPVAAAGEWVEPAPPGGEGTGERGRESPLVLQQVAVRYEGPQLQVRVELLSFGQPRSATVSGPDEGLAPALLGARAVMQALADDPAWQGVHLQWVDLAGVSAAPAVVVSVVRPMQGASPAGGPALLECVGVRPERGNVTLAAAAATVEALVKLLSAAGMAV